MHTWVITGRYFCEKCLTFGSRASPGKYARTARIPIHLACLAADFPFCQACMHLDDLVAVGTEEDVTRFYGEYTSLCGRLGINLQEPDGDKAFGPQRSGVVLGILFDLRNWSWRLEEEKFRGCAPEGGGGAEGDEAGDGKDCLCCPNDGRRQVRGHRAGND